MLWFDTQERLARVHDVIKRLGLAKVAHTQVGTVMSRGLSGGERKRLNVAQELLTDPPVLLADGESLSCMAGCPRDSSAALRARACGTTNPWPTCVS